ncbi:hypothetical protein O3P69_008815 [Scylla paramamosain]|uniref:Uncharacterized protein n=1 Tax=Scylla paramamosain TaxID=85552 RepID=A0AAW0TNP8_SCYPA
MNGKRLEKPHLRARVGGSEAFHLTLSPASADSRRCKSQISAPERLFSVAGSEQGSPSFHHHSLSASFVLSATPGLEGYRGFAPVTGRKTQTSFTGCHKSPASSAFLSSHTPAKNISYIWDFHGHRLATPITIFTFLHDT